MRRGGTADARFLLVAEDHGPSRYGYDTRRKNPVRNSTSASPASTACTARAPENRYDRPVTWPRTAIGDFSWYCNIAEPCEDPAEFPAAPPVLGACDRTAAGHVIRGGGTTASGARAPAARQGSCGVSVVECGMTGTGGWISGGVAERTVVVLSAARF